MPGPAKEGDLAKYAVGTGFFSFAGRNWKTRRFRLTAAGVLTYADGASVKRTIQLEPAAGVAVNGHPTKTTNGAVRDEARSFVVEFPVSGKSEQLLVEAPDALERDAWVAAIAAHLAPASPLATTSRVPPASVTAAAAGKEPVSCNTATATDPTPDGVPDAAERSTFRDTSTVNDGGAERCRVVAVSAAPPAAEAPLWIDSPDAQRLLFPMSSATAAAAASIRVGPRPQEEAEERGCGSIAVRAASGPPLCTVDVQLAADGTPSNALCLRWRTADDAAAPSQVRRPVALVVTVERVTGAGGDEEDAAALPAAPVVVQTTPYSASRDGLRVAVPASSVAASVADVDDDGRHNSLFVDVAPARRTVATLPSTAGDNGGSGADVAAVIYALGASGTAATVRLTVALPDGAADGLFVVSEIDLPDERHPVLQRLAAFRSTDLLTVVR
jgi:hypothetical protein